MLHIHSSNRLEFLLEAMTQAMSSPVVDDPFVPVTVVVQNSGMARWVSQQIARSQGISAHFRFETPGVFLWSAARAWIPGLPEHPHRKEVMMWQIFYNLPELLVRPEFTELARYLATDHASLQRLQLAQQIANTYDRYLIYRPDTINHWEGGGDTHWQAHLWRQISNGIPQHWGTIHTQLNTIATQVPAVALPQRISVFGISDMPPLYTQVLTAIAMHTSVDLYYLNPCEQYWGGYY